MRRSGPPAAAPSTHLLSCMSCGVVDAPTQNMCVLAYVAEMAVWVRIDQQQVCTWTRHRTVLLPPSELQIGDPDCPPDDKQSCSTMLLQSDAQSGNSGPS